MTTLVQKPGEKTRAAQGKTTVGRSRDSARSAAELPVDSARSHPYTTNYKIPELPAISDLDHSPFRHFLFWVIREVHSQAPEKDLVAEVRRRLTLYLLDPILTCLIDQLTALPEAPPKLAYREPTSASLMLLRQPRIFMCICLVRARGATTAEIAEYVNSTFRKGTATPATIKNLLYFFFCIPAVNTAPHKEMMALIRYLDSYRKWPFILRISQVLSGTMPEYIFQYYTGWYSDQAINAENLRKSILLCLGQLNYSLIQGEVVQAKLLTNLATQLFPLAKHMSPEKQVTAVPLKEILPSKNGTYRSLP
ncbi:MAG: hypothetical protein GXO90_00945 [FCB group bacterium]|nr:hypothetical protein [FCB group bacterium]